MNTATAPCPSKHLRFEATLPCASRVAKRMDEEWVPTEQPGGTSQAGDIDGQIEQVRALAVRQRPERDRLDLAQLGEAAEQLSPARRAAGVAVDGDRQTHRLPRGGKERRQHLAAECVEQVSVVQSHRDPMLPAQLAQGVGDRPDPRDLIVALGGVGEELAQPCDRRFRDQVRLPQPAQHRGHRVDGVTANAQRAVALGHQLRRPIRGPGRLARPGAASDDLDPVGVRRTQHLGSLATALPNTFHQRPPH